MILPVYLQMTRVKNLSHKQCRNFLKKKKKNSFSSAIRTLKPPSLSASTEGANIISRIKICYIDVQNIVRAYNHTRYSSTRMQPMIRENARIVCKNITRRWRNEILKKRVRKITYRGDLVRINRAKGAFKKDYKTK